MSAVGRMGFAALIALVVVLRAIESFGRPLQVDEAYTLWLARIPLRDMFERLLTHDVHPPLLFLLLRPFEALGAPDWLYRALGFALTLGSLALLYWLVRLWHGAPAAAIAAVCAGLMPSLIFYDSWIRMYALFGFEALLSFVVLSLLLTHGDWPTAWRRLLWVGWAACVIAQLYTDYLGFVVVGAQLLYVMVVRRDALARAIVGSVVAAIGWLPQQGTFMHQLAFGGVAFASFRGRELLGLALVPGNAVFSSLNAVARDYVAAAIAWAWLLVTLCCAIVASRRSLVLWLGAPSALLVVYDLLAHKLLYADRYHLLLAYALAAWTGVGIAWAWRATPAFTAAVAAVGCAALIAAGGNQVLNPERSTAPWPAVTRVLQHNAQPGDAFVLDQGNSLWVLSRAGAIDERRTLPVLERSDVGGVRSRMAAYRRIWFVRFQSPPVDPDEVVFSALLRGWRLENVWEYQLALPTERVLVALFVK